eukprot:TRINITY_DN1129_c0_g1_i1.p1 TRINITY_DN1129_c0_g1~~TRINITY_DN1129_c0_g1_i1.p1  ORF type:complete len:550 (+),score=127.44 TRINITY_DN1129_c0_g1_i1:268-1917(+)
MVCVAWQWLFSASVECSQSQRGANPSWLRSGESTQVLELGAQASLCSGDVLYLLPNMYPYVVEFDFLSGEQQQQQQQQQQQAVEEQESKAEPSDDEPQPPSPKRQKVDTEKPPCKYGASCYRTNPEHLANYRHEPLTPSPAKKPSPSEVPPHLQTHVQKLTPAPLPFPAVLPAWTKTGSLLYLLWDVPVSPTIYSFDMDDTLITTKSGKKFPESQHDWKWLYPTIPHMLAELYQKGYTIAIFSNQAGINKGHAKEADITEKILEMCTDARVPIFSFVAAEENYFRKPSTDMWDLFLKCCMKGRTPDLDVCLFVGDAAGRPINWKPKAKKDFSCSDRMFAANIGLPFKTPEEFFLGETPAPFSFPYDPRKLLEIQKQLPVTLDTQCPLVSHSQEMIIAVGCPASGKSFFFAKKHQQHGYVIVNRDSLKTQDRCLKMAKEQLQCGKSVCIDNTNPGRATRAPYLTLAKKFDVPVRCFWFQTGEQLAKHLNVLREKLTRGAVSRIPRIAYNVFTSRFEEPTMAEGFTEIKKINWVPAFESEKDRLAFLQYCC